jgi:hypothetical protein
MDTLIRYLLVRDADGAILGEVDTIANARQLLESCGGDRVSIVRVDDHAGEVVGTTLATRVRLLS